VGAALAVRELAARGAPMLLKRVLDGARVRRTLAINADIMIRSLALILVFVWFVANGAAQGDVVLAANAVLLHFISVAAFFLDGLAFAAEALVGRAIGAAQRAGLLAAARITTVWAVGIALVISLVLFAAGPVLIDALT